MATIATETTNTLVTTNVTDDTPYYDTSSISLSSSKEYSSYIIKSGVLWSSGRNDKGQLGLGDTIDTNVFTNTGVSNVKSVYSGEKFAMIIKNDNTVWSCGINTYGQLGLGDLEDKSIFTNINLIDVKTISCGYFSTIAIKQDGTIYGVGLNNVGQLGLNDIVNRSFFTLINISNIKTVKMGRLCSFLINSDGELFVTGGNDSGQLGLGDNVDVEVFTKCLDDIKEVASGLGHTMIIKIDDTLWGTGFNTTGQLGLNDLINKNVFTDTGVAGVKEIDVGSQFSSIVKNDNTVWSTGYNLQGQLGIGNNTDTKVFTDTGATLVDFVVCGHSSLFTIKTDGTIFGTGYNFYGQLGLADNSDRNTLTSITETIDTFVKEAWLALYSEDIVRIEDNRYTVSLLSTSNTSIFATLTLIGVVNELNPFDGQNITPAIFASPMIYKITGTEAFNSFTLAKVLASSVTYTFRLSDTTVIKTETIAIDCLRDENGTLSKYPTTVIYYAGQEMPTGSTVEISLTHNEDVELGDFILNNAIDSGFTKLAFSHGIKDYNNYTPDAWGNIPESVKAIVTTFNVTLDIYLTNYDYAVSFNESISGKNITIDGSDSGGEVANGTSIFSSLTRRVRVTNVTSNSIVKDGELSVIANTKLSVQEIV